MHRLGSVLAFVAFLAGISTAPTAGQDSGSPFDAIASIVDDTTCGDGIGRTYRTATLFSAAREHDEEGFSNRYEACAGPSGRAAESGLTPLPVGMIGQCTDAIVLPGWDYEWVICDLSFFPRGDGSQRIRIDPKDFSIMTDDDKRFAPYVYPDLYAGQSHDISGGVDLVGTEPMSGVIAFAAYPGQIDGPPFLLLWEASGDFLIADELEPEVGEHFIRDMQS